MRVWRSALIILLLVTTLVGCGGSEAAPELVDTGGGQATSSQDNTGGGKATTPTADTGGSETKTDEAIDTSYESALPASSQLALGILQLEETENAITLEQASALLPLWQALQAGTLQSETETNAVLKQIERAITSEQLTVIAAMHLTWEDMTDWAQEQGLGMGLSPEVMATRQAERGGEGGQGQGGFGQFGSMSEEEREAMRATVEAGGGMPFGGNRGNLSQEEREAMRTTAEAGGGANLGGRRPEGGAGQISFVAQPLIELLTKRAAE